MELITTYPAAVNSKATVTMGVLDQATTIVEVLDATVLPEAPNLLVLGTDQTAETVLMTARENNTLTIQRAVQGIAKSWPAGTQIARNFTGKDWDDMRSNVEAIVAKILGLTASDVGALPNNEPVPIDKGGTGATNRTDALGSLMAVGAMINTANYSYLGEITTNGVYQVSTVHPDNPPNSSSYGILLVFQINGYAQQFYQSINDTDSRRFYVRTSGDGGSTWGDWINLADASKFLPLTGGTLSGSLELYRNDSEYSNIRLLSSDKTSGVILERNANGSLTIYMRKDINSGNDQVQFYLASWDDEIYPIYNLIRVRKTVNGVAKTYRVFGDHNKPYGTYTGNGSPSKREINIGGMNSNYCLAIKGGDCFTIVSNAGVLCVTNQGSFVSVPVEQVMFLNGVLTLNTIKDCANKNGETYYYQVL